MRDGVRCACFNRNDDLSAENQRAGAGLETISNTTRLRNFMPAAPRIMRMDSAMRPWRRITTPRL
jgi:hypothetical protein